MSKFKFSVILFGIIVMIVAAALATYFALSFAGVIISEQQKLVFTVNDAIKDYDGDPLVANGYQLTEGGLFKGHTAVVEYTGSQTDAGEGVSGMNVKIIDENNFDVTSEYSIKVNGGKLVVAKAEVSVMLNASDVIYSGEYVIFDDYTIATGRLADGHSVGAAKVGMGIISAGDVLSASDLQPAIYDKSGRNVTYNYELKFSMNKNQFEVSPRPITVKPVGGEKVYDGTVLACNRYEITSGALVSNQYASVSYRPIELNYTNAELLDVGEMQVVADIRIYDSQDNDVTSNYYISQQTATLSVTPRELTVYAKSATREYNGEALSLTTDRAPYSAVGLVNGDSVDVTYSGSVTDVGENSNIIDSYAVKRGTQLVTSNYNVTLIDGTLTVTEAKLTLNLPDISKEYDGTPYSDEITDTFSIGLNKFYLTVEAGSSLENLINAGQTAYSATGYTVENDKGDCTENFNLVLVPGVVSITARQLTLSAEGVSKEYDGSPYAFGTDSVKIENLMEGHCIAAINCTSVIFVTEDSPCTLSLKIVDEKGADISGNYKLIDSTVPVTITARSTDITTDSAEKEYDGTPLTATSGYGSSLAAGDYIGLKAEADMAYIIDVGSADNEFEYEIYNLHGDIVTGNYEITDVNFGTLTVNKKVIKVTISDVQVEFTGYEQGAEFEELVVFEPFEFGGCNFYEADILFEKASFYEAGEYELNIQYTEENFPNFQFDVTSGMFTVTKKQVTLDLISDFRTYNGSALNSGDVLSLYGDNIKSKFDISVDDVQVAQSSLVGAVNAGTYPVETTFQITMSGNDSSANFEIITTNKTYTIVPLELEMVYDYGDGKDTATKVYDGYAFEVDLSKISFRIAEGYEYSDYADSNFINSLKTDSLSYDKIVKVKTEESNSNIVLPQELYIRNPHIVTDGGKTVSSENITVNQSSISVTITKRTIIPIIENVVVDKNILQDDLLDLLDVKIAAKLNELFMAGDYGVNCGGDLDTDGVTIYYYIGSIINADGEDVKNCYNFEYYPAGYVVYVDSAQPDSGN